MKLSTQLERLHFIVEDWKKDQPTQKKGLRGLAKTLKVTYSSLQRAMSGEAEITYPIVDALCNILGYAPEWVIKGKGLMRAKDSEKKTIIEVRMLRAENQRARYEIDVLKERMKGNEAEMEEIKKQIAALKNMIGVQIRDK